MPGSRPIRCGWTPEAMAGVNETLARAGEVLDRAAASRGAGGEQWRYRARVSRAGRKLTTIAIADAGIVFLAIVIGLALPLGMFGALAVLALLIVTTLAIALWPTERAPTPAKLAETDVKALPAATGRWLEAQRPALPAPAVTLADAIGAKLDLLTPQLATLDAGSPQAQELRQLIGEQLPGLVDGYARVPRSLRQVERAGTTPDAQVIEGLKVIDRELAEMSQQLASDDMDALATRGRFLELKYKDD